MSAPSRRRRCNVRSTHCLDRLETVVGRLHLVAFQLQQRREAGGGVVIVVGDHDPHPATKGEISVKWLIEALLGGFTRVSGIM